MYSFNNTPHVHRISVSELHSIISDIEDVHGRLRRLAEDANTDSGMHQHSIRMTNERCIIPFHPQAHQYVSSWPHARMREPYAGRSHENPYPRPTASGSCPLPLSPNYAPNCNTNMSMNEKKRKREDTESEEDFHAKSLRRGGAWNGPGMGKHGVPNVRRTAPERGRRPGRRGRDRNGSGRVSMGGGGGANEEEEDGVGEEENEEDEDEEMEDEEVEDQDKIVAGEKTKKSKGKEQRK
jgi:hypothetical protein